ncbi:hypothetical protein GW17_00033027 [Ensete ventricosum]|nr:hypothetical protein GW17_00033027 [Ensete ventricosum]
MYTFSFLLRSSQNVVSHKKSLLTSLALHFPFLSSLIGRGFSQPENDGAVCASKPIVDASSSTDNGTISNLDSANCAIDYLNQCPQEIQNDVSTSSEIESEAKSSEWSHDLFHENSNETKHAYNIVLDLLCYAEQPGIQNEHLSIRNIGPGFDIAQLWAKDFVDYCYIHHLYLQLLQEAERESEKSWTPVIEIQFRGGSYRGRCQGGLPEGKGRLTFKDGSFYDGMWRNGKRCGLGTLYYSNGDVFQGSWRDDLIHGKVISTWTARYQAVP